MCTYLQMLSITRYPKDLNLTFYLHDTNTTSTTSFPNKNNFLKPDVGASSFLSFFFGLEKPNALNLSQCGISFPRCSICLLLLITVNPTVTSGARLCSNMLSLILVPYAINE